MTGHVASGPPLVFLREPLTWDWACTRAKQEREEEQNPGLIAKRQYLEKTVAKTPVRHETPCTALHRLAPLSIFAVHICPLVALTTCNPLSLDPLDSLLVRRLSTCSD